MISNQVLQHTIDGLTDIIKVGMTIFDTEGHILVSTSQDDREDDGRNVKGFCESPADSQVVNGYQYFKVFDETHLEYIVRIDGRDEESYTVGKIITFQLQSLLVAYKERYDKENFIKNLLLDNLLLVDIYNRAKKLHIPIEHRRVVFVIELPEEKNNEIVEGVRRLFSESMDTMITAVEEDSLIVIRELASYEGDAKVSEIANTIFEILPETDGGRPHVSYGTIVNELREVSRSYKEARMALDVGRIFYPESSVVEYNSLGVGRLVYQLPVPLCKMFIREVFGEQSPDSFDEETLVTIQQFFDNDLNVSETSRQLYIHRNTLVYRLDKLQKSTGLDLRKFSDAITFKIALMVVQYMTYMKDKDY